METVERLLHEGLDLVVTKIADGALVGMMNLMISLELASLDVKTHLLVGIAEGHTTGSQTVHLLDREDRVVHRVVEDVLIHLYLIYNVSGHLQTILQFVEGRQEHFFNNLKVTEIAHGQIAASWSICVDGVSAVDCGAWYGLGFNG